MVGLKRELTKEELIDNIMKNSQVSPTNLPNLIKMREILVQYFSEETIQISTNEEEIRNRIKDVPITTLKQCSDNKREVPGTVFEYYVTIHFPKIEIKNSRGATREIYDLFVRLTYKPTLELTAIRGTVTSITKESYYGGYKHSHLHRVPPGGDVILTHGQFSDFCLGTGPLALVLANSSLRKYEEARFRMLLLNLKQFVKWESLEGVPFYKIADVARTASGALTGGIINSISTHSLNEAAFNGRVISYGNNLGNLITEAIIERYKDNTNYLLSNLDIVIGESTVTINPNDKLKQFIFIALNDLISNNNYELLRTKHPNELNSLHYTTSHSLLALKKGSEGWGYSSTFDSEVQRILAGSGNPSFFSYIDKVNKDFNTSGYPRIPSRHLKDLFKFKDRIIKLNIIDNEEPEDKSKTEEKSGRKDLLQDIKEKTTRIIIHKKIIENVSEKLSNLFTKQLFREIQQYNDSSRLQTSSGDILPQSENTSGNIAEVATADKVSVL